MSIARIAKIARIDDCRSFLNTHSLCIYAGWAGMRTASANVP
jgi:hypothetical protein